MCVIKYKAAKNVQTYYHMYVVKSASINRIFILHDD